MVEIKRFELGDEVFLWEWFRVAGDPLVPVDFFARDTFVAWLDGVPAVSATLILGDGKYCGYVEGFIGNPGVSPGLRRGCSKCLSDFLGDYARERGYRNLVTFSADPVLSLYFERFGFRPIKGNLQSLIRSL